MTRKVRKHKKVKLQSACCHEYFFIARMGAKEWNRKKSSTSTAFFQHLSLGPNGLQGWEGHVCFNGGARCSPTKINAHAVVTFCPQRYPFLLRENLGRRLLHTLALISMQTPVCVLLLDSGPTVSTVSNFVNLKQKIRLDR